MELNSESGTLSPILPSIPEQDFSTVVTVFF